MIVYVIDANMQSPCFGVSGRCCADGGRGLVVVCADGGRGLVVDRAECGRGDLLDDGRDLLPANVSTQNRLIIAEQPVRTN